jgi:molybdenum cofactor biosynthesis protein B
VSDTRTAADDASGRALAVELASFALVRHAIVAHDLAAIWGLVVALARGGETDAIVLTGGTGIAPRDRTYEAIEQVLDKRLDGFGEAFRRLSWDEIGPRAILSRAVAGTIDTCMVFALPGSEKAARLGARALVAPVLAHAVDLLHGRKGHHA